MAVTYRTPATERRSARAFTLTELAVIVGVLAVLALFILPALARTNPDARAFQCLNNHRQLARAWRMYADDNSERFPGNVYGTSIMANNPNAPWVQGWLDWSSRNDNTNTILLTDPRYASIATYCGKNPRLFKCPADQFMSALQRNIGWKRVRSVSANIYVGGVDVDGGPSDPAFVVAKKSTDLTNPGPAGSWLLIDEHPDSMNDPPLFAPRLGQWVDLPANLHDGGAGVAFADGSAEIHRWQASALNFRVQFSFFAPVTPANDADILWLRAHTPRKVGAN